MSLDKLESIPKRSWKALETYLNEKRAEGLNYVRKPVVARETGIDGQDTLAMLSELCEEDLLTAKIKVNCPDCGAQHGGVFARQSNVPDRRETCMCGDKFDMSDTTNWRVVYALPEDDLDFFSN